MVIVDLASWALACACFSCDTGKKAASTAEPVPATEAKMLYALSMTGSHEAVVPVRRKNPFTGEFVDIHPHVLTDAEIAESKRVLSAYSARAEPGNRYVIRLADGTAVEVIAGLDATGEPGKWKVSFGAYLQRLSRDVMQFLFDLCSAGSFIVDGPDVGVVTSEAVMNQHRDSGFALARSPEELDVLLKQGMQAHKARFGAKSDRDGR